MGRTLLGSLARPAATIANRAPVDFADAALEWTEAVEKYRAELLAKDGPDEDLAA
ncbi:hypothetical protein OG698_10775 [Streptomyces sp. NBC_01003]|uniref:hypothetical protein n=1 Tax=Streptomyces sp. NBC_01003 TaxID=2903714 RepID=UPI003869EA8E|nr:hypothetical protein OG698_10775 [Streptomyces sp. NBC_01003]